MLRMGKGWLIKALTHMHTHTHVHTHAHLRTLVGVVILE